jgi:hypothetical protein
MNVKNVKQVQFGGGYQPKKGRQMERVLGGEHGQSMLYTCMKNRTMKPTENVLRRGSRN